jgi:hypothetical protein
MHVEWSLDAQSSAPRLNSADVTDERGLDDVLDKVEQGASELVMVEIVAANGSDLVWALAPQRVFLRSIGRNHRRTS